MKLGTFLLSLVEPILGRILVTIGLSIVTVTGFQQVVNILQDQLVSSVNALPSTTLQLFLIGGGGIGISMIVSAIAVRVMLWQAMNAKKLLGANPS
jgi:predicted glycosyltransferase